ncbi:glycosyltransferase [Mucor lusitanicus]|uniref:Glycosyltransferase family 4 protein n=2 Tax=Mucor circinelloides f. lusitanicus TaxID=29924 RepID=A0A162MTJ3_MUCCL|nr:glycosyltransferase family 4 protein [Mucor lusitanicus]OAD05255.1 glycosyltransferase family 4 protein [Mucor lusitanicus CBS 277.49]
MRIAIVTENFLPKVDGVTRTLTRLLEHLQATGHKVILFGPESGMDVYAGAKLYGTAGIPFLPYPELKLNLWRPAFTKALRAFDPHVIHLVDPVYICAAFLCMANTKKVPIVASYHTNLGTYCTQFGWGLFASLMWSWNRYCHSQCDFSVCPSESTRHILHTKRFRNLRIWPRGIDTALFSPLQRSDALRTQWLTTGGQRDDDDTTEMDTAPMTHKTVILYVGRVSYEKNLGLVLESYKKMDHAKCHLVIVGHGPAFHPIQEDCSRSQTPVTFTGYLQGIDLATAYASADVFAFPSFTETFGQVVLESMASGLPVVGLLAEGVKDLVQDQRSGLLLDTTDMPRRKQIEEYARLLNTLIEDAEMRAKMGQEAMELSRAYTWWGAMESMVQVYRDAAEKHHILIEEEDGQHSMATATDDNDMELCSIAIDNGAHVHSGSDSGLDDDFTDVSSIASGLNTPDSTHHKKHTQHITHVVGALHPTTTTIAETAAITHS